MSKLTKEEKEEYTEFYKSDTNLTDDEIVELNELSDDCEVIPPDSMLQSYFRNIPEVVITLCLTISAKLTSENSPSFVANLIYNPKDRMFEHNIINHIDKDWCETRKFYWKNYRFILPMGDIVEIYSQKGGKGRKKTRYYVVCPETKSKINQVSKRKAYKLAAVRAEIVRILSH